MKCINRGETIRINKNTELRAVWAKISEVTLDVIDWKTNKGYYIGNSEGIKKIEGNRHSTSVASVTLMDNGKTVNMQGNWLIAGKNAIWTEINGEGDEYENSIIDIEFDYSINFGDSFNAAGILLGVSENANNISGYMISFNNTMNSLNNSGTLLHQSWAYNRNGKTVSGISDNYYKKLPYNMISVWKFTYSLDNESNMQKVWISDLLTKEYNYSLNSDSGKVKIQILENGFEIKVEERDMISNEFIEKANYNLIAEGTFEQKRFGFFSDHYYHGCYNIGNFDLTGINVNLLEW